MRNYWFPIRKGGLFRPGKEIKGLRGGVHRYAAQASPKIDAAWAEKNSFRTETRYFPGRKLDNRIALSAGLVAKVQQNFLQALQVDVLCLGELGRVKFQRNRTLIIGVAQVVQEAGQRQYAVSRQEMFPSLPAEAEA